MKTIKTTVLFIAIILVPMPLIDFYFLNERLGKISFGLFSLGIFIHSVNLIWIGARDKRKRNKVK